MITDFGKKLNQLMNLCAEQGQSSMCIDISASWRAEKIKELKNELIESNRVQPEVMPKIADIEEMQKLLGIQKTEIEQLKEQIKAPHKCAGCDTIIYYKSYCDNCQRLWES